MTTGLPISRPRTYGANTPIVPQDLNDLFDGVINLNAFTRRINALGGTITGSFDVNPASPGVITLTGVASIQIPIPLAVGQRLTGLKLRTTPGTSGGITFTLYEMTDGSASSIASANSSGTAAQTLTLAVSQDCVAGQTKSWVAKIDRTAGAANAIFFIEYTIAPTP